MELHPLVKIEVASRGGRGEPELAGEVAEAPALHVGGHCPPHTRPETCRDKCPKRLVFRLRDEGDRAPPDAEHASVNR